MKNKKLYIAMLILTVSFLILMYVLKIWFPQEFIATIENERIIMIGEFIDNNKWANLVFGFVIGLIFDVFYFGAVCRQKVINWKLLLIIIVYGLGLNCYYCFAPAEVIANNSLLVMSISSCYMILLPILYTNELRPLAITYCMNIVSQSLFMIIRNVAYSGANANSLTTALFALDNYLWVIICYLIFNLKNKENVMGNLKPLYGKSKFYAKKKEKAEKKIVKLQEIVRVCDEELSKDNK